MPDAVRKRKKKEMERKGAERTLKEKRDVAGGVKCLANWGEKYLREWTQLPPSCQSVFLAGSRMRLTVEQIDRLRQYVRRKEGDSYPAAGSLNYVFWERLLADRHCLLENPEANRDEVVVRYLPEENHSDLLVMIGKQHQCHDMSRLEALRSVWREKEMSSSGNGTEDFIRQVLFRLAPDAGQQQSELVSGLVAHYMERDMEKVMAQCASPESQSWREARIAFLQAQPAGEEYLRQLWLKKLEGDTTRRMVGWMGLTSMGGGKYETAMLEVAASCLREERGFTGRKELYVLAGWQPERADVRRKMAELWEGMLDHAEYGRRMCAWRGWLTVEENERKILDLVLKKLGAEGEDRDWLPVLKTWIPRDKSVREIIWQELRQKLKKLLLPGEHATERLCVWECLLQCLPGPDLLAGLLKSELPSEGRGQVLSGIVRKIREVPGLSDEEKRRCFRAVAEVIPEMLADVLSWVVQLLFMLLPENPEPDDMKVLQENMDRMLDGRVGRAGYGWKGVENLYRWCEREMPPAQHPVAVRFWQDFWTARLNDFRAEVRATAAWHLCRMTLRQEQRDWNEQLWTAIRERLRLDNQPEILCAAALMAANLAESQPPDRGRHVLAEVWQILAVRIRASGKSRKMKEVRDVVGMVQMEFMMRHVNSLRDQWGEKTLDMTTVVRMMRHVVHLFPESREASLPEGEKKRDSPRHERLWQELWMEVREELRQQLKGKDGSKNQPEVLPGIPRPEFAEIRFAGQQADNGNRPAFCRKMKKLPAAGMKIEE